MQLSKLYLALFSPNLSTFLLNFFLNGARRQFSQWPGAEARTVKKQPSPAPIELKLTIFERKKIQNLNYCIKWKTSEKSPLSENILVLKFDYVFKARNQYDLLRFYKTANPHSKGDQTAGKRKEHLVCFSNARNSCTGMLLYI